MVIVDTNYYVEGLLRKMIKIKRVGTKSEEGPTEEDEAAMRAQAEALEAEGGDLEEAPPETEGSISVKRRLNRREAIRKKW